MAELVAKNASAVAVDENLTTLIDWTNIESLSGFGLFVENAGGGSSNDITGVHIDTSDDGGITSQLDQHDGFPSDPISSGKSENENSPSESTFTE